MSRVWTWRQAIWESDLQATTKLVLQALASHLNDVGGPMFPSQERLSRLCSLSERAVITHLGVAEEKGWIQARKRELNGKRWAANEYVARFPHGVNDVHPFSSDGVKDVQVQGERGSGDGVNDVHTNYPSEQTKEHPTKAPKGPCGWEEDSGFMSVMEAYQKLNPSRVNPAKAWAVWQEHSLSGHSEQILAALPSFAPFISGKRRGASSSPTLPSGWLTAYGAQPRLPFR